MYHTSNLGIFAAYVSRYADNNGFVPRKGDKRKDFNYINRPAGAMPWGELVAKAEEATALASQAAREWAEKNG